MSASGLASTGRNSKTDNAKRCDKSAASPDDSPHEVSITIFLQIVRFFAEAENGTVVESRRASDTPICAHPQGSRPRRTETPGLPGYPISASGPSPLLSGSVVRAFRIHSIILSAHRIHVAGADGVLGLINGCIQQPHGLSQVATFPPRYHESSRLE